MIKKGMIGLSGGKNLMQECIKFFISSKFSHSFIIIDVMGILSALETSSTVVTVSPMTNKKFEKNYVQIWELKTDLDQEKIDYFLTQVYFFSSCWYGYLSFFWFMYRWLCRKFNYEPKRMWNWCKKGMTCTELTCHYVECIFPELFMDLDLNTISPQELLEIMQKNPDKFRSVGWYKE